MNLDDGLEIVTSLLTLVAIAMVALEKARPDDDGARKARLRAFLNTSLLASPRRVQRAAAKIVADALKAGTGLGGLVGILGAPIMKAFKKWGGAQTVILLAMYGLNIAFAARAGSIWLALAAPALALGLVLALATYPAMYRLFNSNSFDDAVRQGDVMTDARGRWILLRGVRGKPAGVLRLLSPVHPNVRRHEDYIAIRDQFSEWELWPFALGMLCLLPLPLALIDGFAYSSTAWRFASLAVGALFLFTPVLVVLMMQLAVFQGAVTRQTIRQTAWSGPHTLRAGGPSAAIAVVVILLTLFLYPPLEARGGGWFALVLMTADLILALLTGVRLRAVIRTRAKAAASLAALGWVICLAVVIAGLKLFLAMAFSGEPLTLLESYRIALGLELIGDDAARRTVLFVAAQTATLAWVLYAGLLVVMLSLSVFASALRSIFGLALSTISPLEILASYLTALAAVVVLVRSLAKLLPGAP